MKNNIKKYLSLKILLALLPALIFWKSYAWITGSFEIIAFLIIWALMIWNVYQFTEKNHIFERFFRLTEISFFLLPVSAIILTSVTGAKTASLATNVFEQAGIAVGTAIGGTFIIIIAFVIGITGGIIMHLITRKYEKKAETSEIKQVETLSNKHGVIISIVIIIFLSFVMGIVSITQYSLNQARERVKLKNSLQQGGVSQTDTQNQDKIQSNKVSLEITKKGFYEADYMSGDYQDQITMDLKLTNETDKDIKGVEGVLTFYDIFDNKISSMIIRYDKSIPTHQSKILEGGRNYNQFIDEDIKLKEVELENLKYKWEITTIIYIDGSKETF